MGHHANSTTALDGKVSIHCDCGNEMPTRLRLLKAQTQFPCTSGAIVVRDLRDFVQKIEELESQFPRRASRARLLGKTRKLTSAR